MIFAFFKNWYISILWVDFYELIYRKYNGWCIKFSPVTTEPSPGHTLSKSLSDGSNNNIKKAKTRVANYEKGKTKANGNLDMKLVIELPNGKEKEQSLKRLK
ncbi:hypothetical protein SOLI23_01855 [Solibacillus silvestris]|nr:hypothetical protein SOLI23_01855 [Solibacillus silvestris]